MKVLIYSYSIPSISELALELIPMGFESIETNSMEETLKQISKNQFPILLSENIELDFLKKVKEISPSTYIFLLIKSKTPPESIKNLSNIKISAIINFVENPYLLAEEIVNHFISLDIKTNEKRSYLRVQPKDFEELKGAIYLKKFNRFIKGKIIDISCGGVAVLIPELDEMKYLIPGTIYDPLIILIDDDSIKTLASLIGIRKNAAGFKFENVEPAGMRKISSYIYYRLSEKNRELTKKI